MKIRIDRDVLADAVHVVAKALPTRPSVPVTAGLLLTAGGDRLEVAGYDYDVANRITCNAHTATDGKTLVSGRLLAEITKALPNKPVDLAAAGTHLELECGSARFTLPTMPVEDYPSLPDMPAAAGTVNTAAFTAAVTQVTVAASRDGALPVLNGALVEFAGDRITMMATDRYRLALREIPWTPTGRVDSSVLVPARALHDTVKTLTAGGDVTIGVAPTKPGQGLVGFTTAGRTTICRLLDNSGYPPARSLFPAQYNSEALVPVAPLVAAVKRVATVAERATPVLLDFTPDGLAVEAGGAENARASEAVDADVRFTGGHMRVAFNPSYLVDGLTSLNTPVAHFGFVDALKPAVLSPASDDGRPDPTHRYLVMPIRIAR